MNELKRILSNRRLCIGLLLILILNGFLFAREQIANDYGLDCTLPLESISISRMDNGYKAVEETVDPKAAYVRYLDWLQTVQDMPLSEAITALKQEKELFAEKINAQTVADTDKLDYVAANNLLTQVQYLTDYAEWLNTIQQNKDKMLSFSIFNDLNSFSGRNILKTAEDFEKLQGVDLSLGADGAINALMSFELTDYFLIIILLLFGTAFLDERKKGLWSVVHTAPNGRLRLAIHRMLILFGVSAFGVLLLYGTNLVIGFSLYGGINDLGRAMQSVELLGKLTVPDSLGAFLVHYILLRIAAAFLVSLLLWLLLIAVNNVKYTIIVLAGVLLAEYSLYFFLPVQSVWNGLKYFNLFTYISLSDLYTNYLNIDLFSYPLGIRSISQLALLPLCLLLAAVCISTHCRKKPAAGKDLLGCVAYGVNSITDRVLWHLRLFGMELHKTLWIQKGVAITALFVYLAFGLSFAIDIPAAPPAESATRRYTTELAGEITEDTFDRIDSIETELDQTIADYESAKIAYKDGKITQTQLNVYVYNAATAQSNKEGLVKLRSRAKELRDYGTNKGFTPWLFEESPYKGTYGEEAKSTQQNAALVAMLTITLLLAGSISYETQSGMNYLLASTQRGRKTLFRRKIGIAALVTTIVWAVTYGLEFHAFLNVCDTGTFVASVQNLSMLKNFPIVCSIGTFLIWVYMFRWMALFACSMLTILISSHMKRLETAYITTCGVILLPSTLYLYVGLEPLKYLSLALSVEVIPLVQTNQPLISLCVIGGLLIVMIGVSILFLRKKFRV